MWMLALFQDVAILVTHNIRVNRVAGERDAANLGGLERCAAIRDDFTAEALRHGGGK
jgi:hypothetical protein